MRSWEDALRMRAASRRRDSRPRGGWTCASAPSVSVRGGGRAASSSAACSGSAVLVSAGRRSMRLESCQDCSVLISNITYHNGHVPDTFRSHGSMHAGWNL
jgi:hypothetical protein